MNYSPIAILIGSTLGAVSVIFGAKYTQGKGKTKQLMYANILGYVKTLQDRWGGFQKTRVDFTKEGPAIIADMENAGIKNADGVHFSVTRTS